MHAGKGSPIMWRSRAKPALEGWDAGHVVQAPRPPPREPLSSELPSAQGPPWPLPPPLTLSHPTSPLSPRPPVPCLAASLLPSPAPAPWPHPLSLVTWCDGTGLVSLAGVSLSPVGPAPCHTGLELSVGFLHCGWDLLPLNWFSTQARWSGVGTQARLPDPDFCPDFSLFIILKSPGWVPSLFETFKSLPRVPGCHSLLSSSRRATPVTTVLGGGRTWGSAWPSRPGWLFSFDYKGGFEAWVTWSPIVLRLLSVLFGPWFHHIL